MAIDADLNAGVLSNEEAKRRREEITQEADFYGAMDGASKFVKGDAIAGILILAINIIGGLIIGLAQHGLSLESAAESYILLSIGDGLVAQIPSLLLAIATAIIVTRVSSTQDMAKHIGRQVSLFRAGSCCRRAVADRLCTGNAKFIISVCCRSCWPDSIFLTQFHT